MGSISNDLEIDWLDHIFENTAFTVPTNIYIALSTADPTETGGSIAEPVGNNYARKVHNTWNAAAARAATNNGVITFNTASGAWGTITHYALFDAITGGNFLAYGSLTTGKAVVNGNTPSIATTDLSVSVNTGGFSDYLAHKMLDHTLKTTSYTQPTMHVGLSTTIPTDAGNVTEPSPPNGYERKTHAAWDAAAAGATQNTSVITFATPTGTWGTCVFATIHDAAAAGNYLARGDITDQTPDDGDTVRFNAGDLDVTLD